MKYEIKYVPLHPTPQGGSQGPYSGRPVSADTPSEAVVAFAKEMRDLHSDRKVAVNKDEVSLSEEDVRILNNHEIEYRSGIESPHIEIVAIAEVK